MKATAALIGALRECETRLNYYATHHTPENLTHLLRSAALKVNTAIKELELLKRQKAMAAKQSSQ
jgi:hypothetical protein